MFNSLRYVKILEGVGFTRKQSEATVEILSEAMKDELATKEDILSLRQEVTVFKHEIREEFSAFRLEVRAEVVAMKEELQLLRNNLQIQKSELIIKMGTMQAASVFLLVTILKLF